MDALCHPQRESRPTGFGVRVIAAAFVQQRPAPRLTLWNHTGNRATFVQQSRKNQKFPRCTDCRRMEMAILSEADRCQFLFS